MLLMRRFVLSLLALVFPLAVFAAEAVSFHDRSVGYDYPYENPYFATLTSRLLKAQKTKPTFLPIAPLAGRTQVPLLENRAQEFGAAVFVQNHAAPVVFIVPGYGGSSREGQPEFLGELLFSLGHSVIIVPNPTNWRFVLAQSTVPMPGNISEEAKDLYRVMKTSVQLAKEQLGLQPTSFGIMGYSIGASHTVQVWKLDQQRGDFRFKKVLLQNPPIDLGYAMSSLDGLYETAKDWSQQQRDSAWGRAIYYSETIFEMAGKGKNVFSDLARLFPISTPEMQFLIGDTFRGALTDGIFAGQQVVDTGAIKTPASKYSMDARRREVRAFSFDTYMRTIAHPYWKNQLRDQEWTIAQFLDEASLFRYAGAMAADPAVHFMHNRDDFVIRANQMESFARVLGPRAFVYPRGGHLGNVWSPVNIQDLVSVFSELK